MFKQAKEAAPKATKVSKKKQKVEKDIDGLEGLAAVNALIKTLETVKESLDSQVKEQMVDHFITEGNAIGRRPENFNGKEGAASGSLQLKVRSSRSKLSEDEQQRLDAANIPYETVTKVEETFIINPAYAQDEELLEKVGGVLEGIEGIPADFIQHQAGVETTVANEDSLNAVFALTEDAARDLLPIVGVLATRVGINETDHTELFNKVAEILG